MQEYKVIVTPQAQEQIVDIARYIKCELESPMAMNNFLETMKDKISSLSVFPERAVLTKEMPWSNRKNAT